MQEKTAHLRNQGFSGNYTEYLKSFWDTFLVELQSSSIPTAFIPPPLTGPPQISVCSNFNTFPDTLSQRKKGKAIVFYPKGIFDWFFLYTTLNWTVAYPSANIRKITNLTRRTYLMSRKTYSQNQDFNRSVTHEAYWPNLCCDFFPFFSPCTLQRHLSYQMCSFKRSNYKRR